MKVNFYYQDGTVKTRDAFVAERENYVEAIILPEEISKSVYCVEVDPEVFVAEVGDEGYTLTSIDLSLANTLTHFREREDFVINRRSNMMPIMGIRRNSNAWFAIASGMSMVFYPYFVKTGNLYKMTARFIIDGEPYEPIKLQLHEIPNGTYNEMAHIYRNWQVENNGLKTLKERASNNPALSYAAGSIELRIRQAWKPAPSHVADQKYYQPPLFVAMDFDRVIEVIDRMKQKGINNVEICLVGWNDGGHDGRFPQLFPAEKQLGGDKKLKELIDYAKQNGYTIVCHDNYTAAYEAAECWDEEYVAKDPAYTKILTGGGMAYRMCPQRAYERFAKTRLPQMRERGFYGLHFVDVFSARPAIRCLDERHPVSYGDCRDYYLKIMNMSRDLIGGFQSEGPFDFVAPALDYCMYTSRSATVHGGKDLELYNGTITICDEVVPFWELVYHGYILSTPNASSVNYTIKDKDEELYMIECAGRPLMYYYSKFGKTMNWMGDTDLYCSTEEEMEASIEAIRKACEFADKYKSLQFETMEKHEKISEGVYQTTFSDNTVITVDYNTKSYNVDWGTK